jgi:putative hydrolase of the HAD superfamily
VSGYAVPRAVIFDWGGTLTPWHTIDPFAQWRGYAERYAPDDPEALTARLVAAEAEAWTQAREQSRAGTLEHVFRSAGVDPVGDRHEGALAAYHAGWEPHTLADPDAVGVLRGLRARGLAVGVLSNTLWTRAFHESVFARDGLLDLIDGAVYSSELPWTKPHAEAFTAAMRAVGVDDPAACVFVGDRLFDDIHGAKEVGMRAVLVPHSAIPDAQKGHVEGEPDAVVQRLGDLLPIVDAWLAGS